MITENVAHNDSRALIMAQTTLNIYASDQIFK